MGTKERIYEELLVLRSQEGDPAAFEELVRSWQSRLWRHASRLTGNEDAAWDVVQDTWLAVASGIGRLQDVAAFRGWVYRIASNKSRDWVRRRARRRKLAVDYGQMQMAAGPGDSDAPDERCTSLREALARLPGKDRAILSLQYEEGFGVADIAGILGIPEGTVKSRIHYAKARLRRLFEEIDDD
jgi:RNA polymerase sigma-70 factor (ECF subfamily)